MWTACQCLNFAGLSEVNQVTEWAQMPVHLPRPNPVFSAKHVNGRLFGLKVLYLSSPPRQPAVMAPGSTHIRRPLSCLTCLALKDDPPPTPNLFANVSTQQVRNGLTAVVERWSGGRAQMRLRRCMKMSFLSRSSPVAQGWLVHINCLFIYWKPELLF